MKKLSLFLIVLLSLSSFGQRSKSVSVIKKNRFVDYCLAKANDTRVDNTDPLNPVYPTFRFRQTSTTGAVTPSGVLDIRSKIVKDGIILNSRAQRFTTGAITDFIGDNSQRNTYPSGILELHLRVPRWQRNKIQTINFATNTNVSSSYFLAYLDVSKLGFVEVIDKLNMEDVNNYISFVDLKNNSLLARLSLYRNSFTTLDLSDNPNLNYIYVRNTATNQGNLSVITFPPVMDNLTYFDVQYNPLTNISGFNAPNLTNFLIENANISSQTINVSSSGGLSIFSAVNSNLRNLNFTNNTNLRTLNIGSTGSNSNNFSAGNLLGINSLNQLRILNLGSTNISSSAYPAFNLNNYPLLEQLYLNNLPNLTYSIDLEDVPNLQTLRIDSSPNISVNFNPVNIKPSLTSITIGSSNSGFVNSYKLPNLTYIHSAINNNVFFDLSGLTGTLSYIYVIQNHSANFTTFDISNIATGTVGNNSFALRNNSNLTTVKLPSRQIASFENFYSNPITTLTGLNSISRNNTTVYLNDFNLATLNTSFGATSCFQNCTALSLGGSNDTYTSTAVYDFRKNNVALLNIIGNHFQVNGNLGTDTCANATFINITGDSDLSYTGTGAFGNTMQRLFLRPKSGSGLATSGDQVANLVIRMSQKNWTSSTQAILISGNSYATRVLDLRGNCAVPTPSSELTTAINTLTTAGVTVLLNS